MIAETPKRAQFRELSYLLDDEDVPLSICVYNVPEAWSVHVFATRDEVPVVKSGDDLTSLIHDAVETYRRRRVVSGMGESASRKKT